MKVALLYSGLFRNGTELMNKFVGWLESQESIDQVDIYVHAWWDKEYEGKRTTICGNAYLMEGDPRELLHNKLKVKKIVVEKQCEFDMKSLPLKTMIAEENIVKRARARDSGFFGTISQMISTKRCLDLIENINDYDCIIRTRSDLFLDDVFKFDLSKKDLQLDRIWFADGERYGWYSYDIRTYAGSPKVMKFFIDNMENVYRYFIAQIGTQTDCHIYVYNIAVLMGIEPIRWFIPLNISRDHLIKDNTLLHEEPFWWDLIPKERLEM
jgi:hypothetical protein